VASLIYSPHIGDRVHRVCKKAGAPDELSDKSQHGEPHRNLFGLPHDDQADCQYSKVCPIEAGDKPGLAGHTHDLSSREPDTWNNKIKNQTKYEGGCKGAGHERL